MKKINKYVLALIISFSFILVFLGLSIARAFYTIDRTEKSINNIGKIIVDNDLTLTTSKNKLDKAINYYQKLDRNLKLETKIKNIESLNESKKEFVDVSIVLAISVDNQKAKLNLSDSDVAKYVSDINEYQKAYISASDFEELNNYDKYLIIYEKYKDLLDNNQSDGGSSGSEAPAEEPEIC